MIRLGRSVAVVCSALAIAVAMGCGAAHGTGAKAAAVSACGTATAPAWSPDGTQIAWYGYRWPRPHNHAVGSFNILRAVCVSDANGKHLHPLRNTVCSEHCSNAFSDPIGQLEWVTPTLLLAGNDLGIYTVPVGQKPKLLGKTGPTPFSTDASGDRVASGLFGAGCTHCPGPAKVLGVPSGNVVGLVGGSKLENSEPSLSPDGTQVVFARRTANDAARPSIWTASADGSHLQLLEKRGDDPLWSPAGNRIAYLTPTGEARYEWRLVAPQGGASTTLLRNGFATAFGWSPNGRWIAFPDAKGRLVVVDVVTRKVRRLLKLQPPYGTSTVAWSPNSRQLLVVWRPPAHSGCPGGLWRVPIDGSKPQLVHGC